MNKYVHIPFCTKKCFYCDFTTFEGAHNHEKYFYYLDKEMDLYENYELDTLYFGGGTPSVVDPIYLNNIVERSELKSDSEITIEFNPESDFDNLQKYRANRLSIGIQTFDDGMLKKIGRIHNSKRALDCFYRAREYFDNITIDLMFALPGQSMEMLKKDLKMVKKLSPEHISIYSLIWKENTPFYAMRQRGRLKAIDEEVEADFYEYIIDFLEDLGYEHYEVSSFCKKGRESKHNLVYWQNMEYLGCGLGASGFIGDRYRNYRNFSDYYKAIDLGKKPVEEAEAITKQRKKEYDIILKLRMLKIGVDVKEVSEDNREILDRFVDKGLLTRDVSYRLTRRGLFLSNEIFSEVIS
tara:strand:- start:314 stop:1372 length:1059 start_codon:yes stop_codon:yes gene_type:complete